MMAPRSKRLPNRIYINNGYSQCLRYGSSLMLTKVAQIRHYRMCSSQMRIKTCDVISKASAWRISTQS